MAVSATSARICISSVKGALALVAILLRRLLPAGWMPNPHGASESLFTICTMDGLRHVPVPHQKGHDGQKHANTPASLPLPGNWRAGNTSAHRCAGHTRGRCTTSTGLYVCDHAPRTHSSRARAIPLLLIKHRCARTAANLAATSHGVAAHGIVGDRFFPATLITDDPFAADEPALPTVTSFDHEADIDMEYSKSILPGIAISINAGYIDLHPAAGVPKASGVDDISLTPTVELWRNTEHEAIVTAGFIWTIGGSGSKSVADCASRYAPEIRFGKGLGDLPDSMALLKPLALTGQLGLQIPGTRRESNAVQWNGALEYSLLYLQNTVSDGGLSPTLARFVPLVEFSLSSPIDQHGGGTTGTINPGLAWLGQYMQLTAEAMIPVNRASGRTVGAIAQLHLYIGDLFPDFLERPIFGERT